MAQTPFDLSFEDLVEAAAAASKAARDEAASAGVAIATLGSATETSVSAGPDAAEAATVTTLGAHMCKWPIGDPASDSFTFCGRRALAEEAYCAEHYRVAYGGARRREAKGRNPDLVAANLEIEVRRRVGD